MILEFSVTNFRSIKETQTLSLIADPDEDKRMEAVALISDKLKVLKSTIIYGPNASGKSNLLLALKGLQHTVLIEGGMPSDQNFEYYQPFLFDQNSIKQPTDFELNFLLEGIRYKYFLSILKNKVKKESLYYYPNGKEAKLFDRNGNKYSYGESLKGKKKTVESLTSEGQLYLFKGAVNSMELLAKAYTYFVNSLGNMLVFKREEYNIFEKIDKSLYDGSYDEIFKKNMKFFIRSFDTGVTDFEILKQPHPVLNHLGIGEYRILTTHEIFENNQLVGTYKMDLGKESEGTQRLFYFSALITDVLMNGKIIIIDELERSLHPHIANFIIQMFNNPKVNKNNAQIIVTTHDATLLDEENEMRQDQIWFITKDRNGASDMYSLCDFEDLNSDLPLDKWYLSGRFGAIPGVDDLEIEFNFQHESKKTKAEA